MLGMVPFGMLYKYYIKLYALYNKQIIQEHRETVHKKKIKPDTQSTPTGKIALLYLARVTANPFPIPPPRMHQEHRLYDAIVYVECRSFYAICTNFNSPECVCSKKALVRQKTFLSAAKIV